MRGDVLDPDTACSYEPKSDSASAGRATDNGSREEMLDVAIVGGGFSGVCTAYHLLSRARLPLSFRIAIIEPCERLGAGLAYSTDSPHHLLNVRAKGMSITEADSSSFVSWLQREAPEFAPDDFVPRRLFRRYINDCLQTASTGRGEGSFTHLRDEATALEPLNGNRGYLLRLAGGGEIRARSVVLALGNIPPKCTFDNGILCSPWNRALDFPGLRILAIVGAGLTAIDVILEAEASGFTGRYHVISTHGHFPKCHKEPHTPVPTDLREWAAELAAGNAGLRSLLREFRLKRKSGGDWEHLVDALRKHAPSIWKRLDSRDRRRFLCRFRNIWNTHLHRSCMKSMAIISALKESGRLVHISARVIGAEEIRHDGIRMVRLLFNPGKVPSLDVDMAVNGTGLFSDILRTESRLVAQLISHGVAVPDEFRLGFKVAGTGQLVSADGCIHPGLFTIGTLRRGEELECTAVPEIRRQVKDLAEKIAIMSGL
jgi:uncharacterized NAD(P)/FAD-binding protein YdhS